MREGEYAPGYRPVTSNVFHIPERLKELDERYFVLYNTRTGRFELHIRGQVGGTLGCVFPFDELDARALLYAREHHVSRLKQLAREAEAHNEKLEKEAENTILDKANEKMKQALKYLDRHTGAEELPGELIHE